MLRQMKESDIDSIVNLENNTLGETLGHDMLHDILNNPIIKPSNGAYFIPIKLIAIVVIIPIIEYNKRLPVPGSIYKSILLL